MSTPVLAPHASDRTSEWLTPAARAVEDFAGRSVDEWLAACRKFLDWHRANRLVRDAPPEACRESDRAHAWLLRSARILQGQMLDPEFPHRELARRVDTALWQLEEAWAQTHNAMTNAESDTLLSRFFPPHAQGT